MIYPPKITVKVPAISSCYLFVCTYNGANNKIWRLNNMKKQLLDRSGFLLLSLVAGFILGICPVTAFVLGFYFKEIQDGDLKLSEVSGYIASGLIGQIAWMLLNNEIL